MKSERRQESSQEPTLNPEHSQVEEFQEPSSMGLKIAIVVFVLIAGIAAGYGWLQHDAAQQLASERAELARLTRPGEEPRGCLDRKSQRLERRPGAGRGRPRPS